MAPFRKIAGWPACIHHFETIQAAKRKPDVHHPRRMSGGKVIEKAAITRSWWWILRALAFA
jgi:hypothetical protein